MRAGAGRPSPGSGIPLANLLRWIGGIVGFAALVVILLLAVFGAGVLAQKAGLPGKARDFLAAAVARPEPNSETAVWMDSELSEYTLQWAKVRVASPGSGGAIAEAGGNIVISSPQGSFSYLGRDNRLAPLSLKAPMNLSALYKDKLAEDPLMDFTGVRTHDLFIRETAAGRFDLYATLTRFEKENCFKFVLARAQLELTTEGGLRAVSPAWQDVYTARPGCIRYKDRSWRFVGIQAAGRMQMLDQRTMLVSIGDHQFDGFNDSHKAPMDPEWDLGKIIALDLETGASRIYAQGLRNPQGLIVMHDGRIVESEQGPLGGDEINVIREGENYGWPQVTYGSNYGYPRRHWPTNSPYSAHEGYKRPALAFVPSVGLGGIAQPDAKEFPAWANDDIFIASLGGATLFHVRLAGEEVAYAEPIRFEGERLRDVITLSNGLTAVYTDSGHIIFLRNIDHHRNDAHEITISGFANLPHDNPAPPATSTRQLGKQMFGASCASCHSLAGEAKPGPPLQGVVGRRIGSIAAYPYSSALKGQKGAWTENLLLEYITDPQKHFPGTTMPQPTLSWTHAPAIVDYLKKSP